jgi:hypothetical protein
MMADTFLYLTTRGRTTGEPRQIEIWFVEHDGRYYLCSERREQSNWVKNIEHDAAISWSIGTRGDKQASLAQRAGRGRVVSAQKEPELAKKVAELFKKKYGWSEGLFVELSGD